MLGFLRRSALLPTEVVILVMGGLAMLTAGIVVLSNAAFSPESFQGLLLVLFALQMIALGKTPFGDLHRPRLLLGAGVVVSSAGIVASVSPGLLGSLPRWLLVLCFGPGGLCWLLSMLLDPGKMRSWLRHGGLLLGLLPACGAVYLLSMVVGGMFLKGNEPQALPLLTYGVSLLVLAFVLSRVYAAGLIPEHPAEHALILLAGLFQILIGSLLVPVNLGLLGFSSSAQLGLLMVIFALQMWTSGTTPVGPFPRTWLMLGLGLLAAVTGIVSCLVPDLLTSVLTVLVGVLNILGGLANLTLLGPAESSIARAIRSTQILMSVLSLLFGVSMLFAHLVPGLVIGVVLALNGSVLLVMLGLLRRTR